MGNKDLEKFWAASPLFAPQDDVPHLLQTQSANQGDEQGLAEVALKPD